MCIFRNKSPLHDTDSEQYFFVKKTHLMRYLSSVYFINQPLHVSGIFVAHHQRICFVYIYIYILGVDGWIILGWISRRWDVGIWTGLGWPRIGTGVGRL